MEVQVWYSVPVAAHVDTDAGTVTRVVVIDEMIRLHTDLCDFATVATLPTGPAYQYAWSTIARVMRAGGSFKS